jgi:hypothetical protein
MPLTRFYNDRYKHRPASYYNPVSDTLWSEHTHLHPLGSGSTLSTALAACDTPVLYVLPTEGNRYPSQKDVYGITDCKVKKFLSKTGVATVKYEGKTVDMYPVNLWFDVSPGRITKDVIKGHMQLQQILEDAFQPRKVHTGECEKFSLQLLATPAQMGMELLKRSLPYKKEYPQLPDDVALILLSNYTQGHFETFYHGTDIINDLHYYDGRWMYASCYRHVPTGEVVHDEGNDIVPYVPGFYRARVHVPADWDHIGLIPCVSERDVTYPRSAGQTFETWVWNGEMVLAMKHGWTFDITERIYWPNSQKEPEPLKLWGDRLVKLRMEDAEKYPEPFRTYLRSSLRNILLQTVGSFHRHAREYDFYTTDENEIPANSTGELYLHNGLWQYTLAEKLSPLQRLQCQPHWAEYLWSQARKKLAEQALKVPFKKLVGLRADGVWCDCPVDYGVDTGKPGFFVQKPLQTTQGLKWPKDNGDMLRMMQQAKG